MADIYVAVGGSGKLATSSDATTWTQGTSSFGSSSVIAVAAGNIWVASGGSNKIASATDPTSVWTQGTIDSFNDINGFAWDGSLWVAVSGYGQVFTSSDGTTWSEETSGLDGSVGDALYDVTYGGGLFVAVGSYAFDSAGAILTSPDGATWTPQTPPSGFTSISCVAFGGSTYVIGKGVSGTGSGPNKLAHSSNATSWTAVSTPFTDSPRPITIAYGNSLFVAAGTQGVLATSSNGSTWTSQTSSFSTTAINDAYYGTTWVAVGNSGKLATSSDAVTWTQQTSSFSTTAINGVSWGTIFASFPTFTADAVIQGASGAFGFTANSFIQYGPLYSPRNQHDRDKLHRGTQPASVVEHDGDNLEDVLRDIWYRIANYESGLFSRATLTANSVLRRVIGGSFTGDAFLARFFTADSYFIAAFNFTADAVLKKTLSFSFTADAEIFEPFEEGGLLGDHTLARHTLGGGLPDDPVIVFESFTADAWIFANITETFVADAHIGEASETGLLGDHLLANHELGGD